MRKFTIKPGNHTITSLKGKQIMKAISNELIKVSFKCPEEYKSQFQSSSCLLTISVGQEVHDGEKFKVTIDAVNAAFDNCTILVEDSLQRHTLKIASQLNDNELYDLSIIEGNCWLERNKHVFERLEIPYTVIRWDKWLKHAEYKNKRMIIDKLYLKNDFFKNEVDASVIAFLARYLDRLNDKTVNKQAAFELSTEYLKEECAALCLWVEGSHNFEVYPSKRNRAMSAAYKLLVEPHFPNLLKPVAIKFKYCNNSLRMEQEEPEMSEICT